MWRPKDKAAEEAQKRDVQNRQLKERAHLVIQDILQEMGVERSKAFDDAKKLTPAKCRNLTAIIQERFGSIERRIREIEAEAYRAIDDGNDGHLLDLSHSIDNTVRPMLRALAGTVKAECEERGIVSVFSESVDWLVRNKAWVFGAGGLAALAETARRWWVAPDNAQKPKVPETVERPQSPQEESGGTKPA